MKKHKYIAQLCWKSKAEIAAGKALAMTFSMSSRKSKMKRLIIIILLFSLGCTHTEYIQDPFSKETLNEKKASTSLNEALKEPDAVYSLSLKEEWRTEFPERVLTLKNLHTLVLNANRLKKLPSGILPDVSEKC